MAFRMWICRGSDWGSLWNEWASAGDLWGDVAFVGAAFSRYVAGIFFAGEFDWHGGVLACGALGSCCDTLLPDVFASSAAGGVAGQSGEPSSAWRYFFEVRLRGAGGYWSC